MIKEEFLRFLQTLKLECVPADVRKIANLVLENLDTLQLLTTHQGQRVKKLVELSQAQWHQLRNDIYAEVPAAQGNNPPFKKLVSLQVGPFRGFARTEQFDLNSQLVFVYGPNGTGKSSFCEALEFGLLGNVAEADSKRIRPQDYLKNAFVNRYDQPIIEVADDNGQIFAVTPNETINRFCFVEKNRIDNFSRIAAQLPAKQSELISTLFGLDSFSEFVKNFTAEIDPRYIDLVGVKGQELAQKQQQLAASHLLITDNTRELTDLAQDELLLAGQLRPGVTFAELLDTIGTPEKPGEIAALEVELQQPLATKSGLTVAALQLQKQQIEEILNNLAAKTQELTAVSTDLSFKQLYTAVTALENANRDECPACQTPLARTSINPFEHANRELEKLAHLSQLEQDRDHLHGDLLQSLRPIYQSLKTVCERFSSNPLQPFLLPSELQIDKTWWTSLEQVGADGHTALQHLFSQVTHLEQSDTVLEQALLARTGKQSRLAQLRDIERQATILQTRRSTLSEGIERANAAIAAFSEANATLIAAAVAERPIVVSNNQIATAYADFVARLTRYKDGLPGRLIADLGDLVVQLYNAFNRNDPPKDLAAAIKLPLAQGQHIEIKFQGSPSNSFDALHILSEGHIRCLGLAILMAKNIKENCPVLIFDDPVNAIDDDHKESIRKTLFEDNFFEEKQIILTCHGEEFFKDIHNLLGRERSRASKNFTFLPNLADSHILVDFHCAPRNYILAAQGHIERLEVRSALSTARQALESIAKGKLWSYVSEHGDGNLSIKLRSAKSPIELRDLADQIRSKISKGNFSHQDKAQVFEPLDALLQMNGDSREWRYLNKGTHEEIDRAEFDRQVVAEIIHALDRLDSALN